MVDRKHILVVDREGLIRETITTMLEDAGYQVSSAGDGASVRQILKDGGIDAVVIDASMRGETSTSLAEHAKSLRLPVVMISGNDAVTGYAADHGLQLLHKPFRVHELCDALDEAFVSGKFGQRDAWLSVYHLSDQLAEIGLFGAASRASIDATITVKAAVRI